MRRGSFRAGIVPGGDGYLRQLANAAGLPHSAGTPGPGLLFTSSRRFPRSRRNPAPLVEALDTWLGQPDVARRPPEDWLGAPPRQRTNGLRAMLGLP